MNNTSLQAIPAPLHWMNAPLDWQSNAVDALSIKAGAKTDLFVDPQNEQAVDNAPRLLFESQDRHFLFSANVSVDFRTAFDAGVLLLYAGPQQWAKLCFEYTPDHHPMIVSVVTQTVSDDCNSQPIAGNAVYLRIARLDRAFAFHFSEDSRFWQLARLFRLGSIDALKIGFSAQSPTGASCSARFTDITFEKRRLAALRNGE